MVQRPMLASNVNDKALRSILTADPAKTREAILGPRRPSLRRRDLRVGLERVEAADGHTLGRLRLPGGLRLWTLEPPWRDNRVNESCIPAGRYLCVLRQSPRFGLRYWLQDTDPRSYVLAHAGNLPRHTRGCILPGMRRGWLGGQRAVLNSRRALRILESGMGGRPFWLEIDA